MLRKNPWKYHYDISQCKPLFNSGEIIDSSFLYYTLYRGYILKVKSPHLTCVSFCLAFGAGLITARN